MFADRPRTVRVGRWIQANKQHGSSSDQIMSSSNPAPQAADECTRTETLCHNCKSLGVVESHHDHCDAAETDEETQSDQQLPCNGNMKTFSAPAVDMCKSCLAGGTEKGQKQDATCIDPPQPQSEPPLPSALPQNNTPEHTSNFFAPHAANANAWLPTSHHQLLHMSNKLTITVPRDRATLLFPDNTLQ
ncbi:hypothetical protein K504DRAFT_503126 [Pleomassaria siparia CBS 279.74]|uniref:Uncharacterized protein n=1 Tax=Pleomassaria siparia CBS 279.74 TaxID=1314801 RepID=A0A6G1K8B1_9PLEO|nr:hypothetical protein K504DRAFT_503126 [Pleomassaria siparia CBS 279.74]